MVEHQDGGPAFPRVGEWEEPGMSLRDYFAAHAPPMTDEWWEDSAEEESHWVEAQAAWNYAYADAMLKAREEPPA